MKKPMLKPIEERKTLPMEKCEEYAKGRYERLKGLAGK